MISNEMKKYVAAWALDGHTAQEMWYHTLSRPDIIEDMGAYMVNIAKAVAKGQTAMDLFKELE